jgi:hypothetical protein
LHIPCPLSVRIAQDNFRLRLVSEKSDCNRESAIILIVQSATCPGKLHEKSEETVIQASKAFPRKNEQMSADKKTTQPLR